MKWTSLPRRAMALSLPLMGLWLPATRSDAHMPWLATDSDGHAVMWFGESPDDRNYHMPPQIAAMKLHSDGSTKPIEWDSVHNDDWMGVRSIHTIDDSRELVGHVTYGLYHGTRLTYHVEHLPHADRARWPTQPRADEPYQTIVTPSPAGGVSVAVLADGKPIRDAEVRLLDDQGESRATATTDIAGMVTFDHQSVAPGLNAVMVHLTDAEARGQWNGEAYGSTTDIMTATFFLPGQSDHEAAADKDHGKSPKVQLDHGASVVPSGLTDLPETLTSFGGAIAGQKIYVYGGHTGNAHSYSIEEQSNRFWSLDLASPDQPWMELPGGPRLQGLALVAHQGRLIRMGGFTALNETGEEHRLQSQTSVAAFDIEAGTWSDLPPLPEPRSSFDAAVLGNRVYVFGGWNLSVDDEESTWHQTAWSLDLSDPQADWKPTAEPPFQRRAVSVAAVAGKLFVIGGMRPEGGPTTRVDIYDPQSDQWTVGPAIPGSGMSGFGSAAFATGGKLLVTTMDGYVHQLASDGADWMTIAKADSARFFHRMLPISDRELLLVGGANMETGKFSQIDAVRIQPDEAKP